MKLCWRKRPVKDWIDRFDCFFMWAFPLAILINMVMAVVDHHMFQE